MKLRWPREELLKRRWAAVGLSGGTCGDDCLVAAATMNFGGRLATGNIKDFPMPKLQVEHWPAGR